MGRAGFVLCCRRGLGSARTEGLGALVAASQPRWSVAVWWIVLLVLGVFAVGEAWWLGPVAVALAAGVLLAFGRHVQRRFGGITGDVLGAASEIATTVALVVCSLR